MFHFISRQINSRTCIDFSLFILPFVHDSLTTTGIKEAHIHVCSDIYVRELKPRVNLVINIMLHCSFFSVSSHKDVWERHTIILSLTVWCCMRRTHNHSLTHCLVLCEKNTQSFSHSLSGAVWEEHTIILSLTVWCYFCKQSWIFISYYRR